MNTVEFRILVAHEFPQLRHEIEYWEDDLPTVQMGEFLTSLKRQSRHAHSMWCERASRLLLLPSKAATTDCSMRFMWRSLEHLDFRSDPGKEAFLLMPAELKKGRYDVLDYDEKLLGRKLTVDDRA
jgi:hypothetical protein